VLTGRIRAIHAASDGTFGSPNIHAELSERGTRVGCKRLARLMLGGSHSRCEPAPWFCSDD
jgi:hypothetical protein